MSTPNYRTPKPQEWKSEELSRSKYADWKFPSVSDGTGVRGSLFVSGCKFQCKHCFNQSIWDFNAGLDYTKDVEDKIISDLSQPYVQGLTLLGGEPFLNTGILIPLVDRVRRELPDKDIWSWTGYTWEELKLETPDKLELLSKIDVLVDGRFDIQYKTSSIPFRGSSNQRIINVQESLKTGTIITHIK